ncbi:MAG: hypothetical protein SGPRY_004462 [Prymnesium sp.]
MNLSQPTQKDLLLVAPSSRQHLRSEVHAVLAERARLRKEADDERKRRSNERAQQQSSKAAQLNKLHQKVKDSVISQAAVKSLSRPELLAVLHYVDNAHKKEHNKLNSNAEMMTTWGGGGARKRRREVASESEELESDESNHSEEYEDTEFTMVKFEDACRYGRTYRQRLR